jgi:hypothetical protein
MSVGAGSYDVNLDIPRNKPVLSLCFVMHLAALSTNLRYLQGILKATLNK